MDHWVVVHWFELSTLILLGLNLWFVLAVLEVLRATSRWLDFLSVKWDQINDLDHKEHLRSNRPSDLPDLKQK